VSEGGEDAGGMDRMARWWLATGNLNRPKQYVGARLHRETYMALTGTPKWLGGKARRRGSRQGTLRVTHARCMPKCMPLEQEQDQEQFRPKVAWVCVTHGSGSAARVGPGTLRPEVPSTPDWSLSQPDGLAEELPQGLRIRYVTGVFFP
jgi:hypothetical protein